MTRLPVRYTTGYKYRLDKTWEYWTGMTGCAAMIEDNCGGMPWVCLQQDGVLRIREGYCWDGASGPTWDKPASAAIPASLAHDALYQLMRARKLGLDQRENADNVLYNLAVAGGMWRWRALLWRRAVRKFGLGSARPQATEVLEA